MAQSGIGLLSMTAANAEDPQTLRMVAGAIANLCGNGKLSDLFQCLFGRNLLVVCVTKYEGDCMSSNIYNVLSLMVCARKWNK
jgi:kinesin family protein 5